MAFGLIYPVFDLFVLNPALTIVTIVGFFCFLTVWVVVTGNRHPEGELSRESGPESLERGP